MGDVLFIREASCRVFGCGVPPLGDYEVGA